MSEKSAVASSVGTHMAVTSASVGTAKKSMSMANVAGRVYAMLITVDVHSELMNGGRKTWKVSSFHEARDSDNLKFFIEKVYQLKRWRCFQ